MIYRYIFEVVAFLVILSVFSGFIRVLEYKKILPKKKKIWQLALFTLIGIPIVLGIPHIISKGIALLPASDYLFVLLYTVLLSVWGYEGFYRSPKLEAESAEDAFKTGYTREASKVFIVRVSINVFVQVAYIVILVFSQLEDLGFIKMVEEGSYFLSLNKYGIIIVYAVQKLITEIKKATKTNQIINESYEAYLVHSKQAEKESKERINKFLKKLFSRGDKKRK